MPEDRQEQNMTTKQAIRNWFDLGPHAKYGYWAGLDNAPGKLTWSEWARIGVSESAVMACAPGEHDADRFADLGIDEFVKAMNDLWATRLNLEWVK